MVSQLVSCMAGVNANARHVTDPGSLMLDIDRAVQWPDQSPRTRVARKAATMTDIQPARRCPLESDFRVSRGNDLPALATYDEIDELADRERVFWSGESQGYYVFLRHETIQQILECPERFSSRRPNPNVPAPEHDLIPVTMDPPEHTKWRRVLGRYFTPRRAERMTERMREVARDLIDGFADQGECDFIADFSARFPAAVFLEMMGLPLEELDRFLAWTLKTTPGPNPNDPAGAIQAQSQAEVMEFIAALIKQRREDPDPRREDIISDAVNWRIDGRPPTDEELMLCCLTLFEAGLDTVNAQLSYAFHHLATHESDRAWLARQPAIIPHAVEEFLRAFPIVKVGREVKQESELEGYLLQPGDRLLTPLMASGRDKDEYTDARTVRFDRQIIRHISFGAGPHRCIGAHIARQELVVALEEWHRRIPDYDLVDHSAVTERTGVVCGLNFLPLRWPTS